MKRILGLFSLVFVLFFIASCAKTVVSTHSIAEIVESISIDYAEGDDQEHVTQDLGLPLGVALDSNIKISWASSNLDVIDNIGKVTPGNQDVLVDVIYTVNYLETTFSSTITFNVIGDLVVSQANYEINYYFQNIDDNLYTLVEVVEMDNATVGNVYVNPVSEIGFTLNTAKSVLIGRTSVDETIALEVYYDRNIYEINLYDGETLIDSIQVKHGDSISLSEPMKEDYNFIEWRVGTSIDTFDDTLPITEALNLKAIFQPVEDNYEYVGYYQGAAGLYDDDLVTFLHQISNATFSGVTYGDVRYKLDDTDRDPLNSNNLILVYLGTSISGTWDSGTTWNREHVWPQSKLGDGASNGTANIASDLQNLKPSDPGVNSSRGNKFYGNTTTADTFAPRDEVKGDIARILFYMDVMYSQLSLIYANDGGVYEMGNLEVLLSWHELDPVDDFEMNRNDLIEDYQGNRNPFIDHPEFVDKIYSDEYNQLSLDIPKAIFSSMIN